MNQNLHAHVSTYSVDCDGGISRAYVETFNDDERTEQVRAYFNGIVLGYDEPVNDMSDISFMNRVMTNVAGPYAVQFGMRIDVDENGIDVREGTEEGHREASVRWCRDEHCNTDHRAYRDHRAEAYNY